MKQQRGFALVMAIFVLVALGLLGTYMVRLSGVQHNTTSYSLQGARAYQAAKAGLNWGIARILNGGDCAALNAQSALTFPGITGFTVSLACTSTNYSEADANRTFFRITAQSRFGAYTSQDYVARELEVSILNRLP